MILTVLVVAAIMMWLGVPTAQAATPETRRVVIVIAPYLTWSDIDETATPTMWSLAQTGSIGDINARSRTRQPDEPPSPLEGALTISAGAWAVPNHAAAAAYNIDERYEVGTAAEAFRRMTGDQVGVNSIVFLGFPMTASTNAERGPEAVLGTLGQAIEDAGGLTAAIGNSDVGYVTGEQRRVRPAALAAMNEKGLVRLGDVSTRMLEEDPHAPFGIRTDMEYFESALDEVDDRTAEHEGPSLIVLDAGDGYRAQRFEPQVTPGIAAEQRAAAMRTLDDVVALAADRFADDVVMVVSQATGDPRVRRPEGLGPVIVSGESWNGFVTSNSTQREGLVTNLDVNATVVRILGVERPVRVLGNPMRPISAPEQFEDRVETLRRMDRTAVAIDSAKPPVVNSFVGLTVIALLMSAFVMFRGRAWSSRALQAWVMGIKAVLLFVLTVPLSSWVALIWWPWPSTAAQAAVGLYITAAVLWALSVFSLRYVSSRVPVAILSLATVLVLCVDQFLGAPISFTNFFGYSPLLGARFYGMGNEAAAILVGAAIVGLAMLFDEWPDSDVMRMIKLYALPPIGLLVVLVGAAPFWGANVAVAVWGMAAFGPMWILMNDLRVTWKSVAVMFGAATLLVVAFAAIDILTPGSQTHLARSLESAGRGGIGELWTIVSRKAATNLRVLTRTNWAYILIATLAFLGVMRWRPSGEFAATLKRNPHFAHAITVTLVSGLVAYFTEDSGIVIPALEVFYLGVALAWLMLSQYYLDILAERRGAAEAERR